MWREEGRREIKMNTEGGVGRWVGGGAYLDTESITKDES